MFNLKLRIAASLMRSAISNTNVPRLNGTALRLKATDNKVSSAREHSKKFIKPMFLGRFAKGVKFAQSFKTLKILRL